MGGRHRTENTEDGSSMHNVLQSVTVVDLRELRGSCVQQMEAQSTQSSPYAHQTGVPGAKIFEQEELRVEIFCVLDVACGLQTLLHERTCGSPKPWRAEVRARTLGPMSCGVRK